MPNCTYSVSIDNSGPYYKIQLNGFEIIENVILMRFIDHDGFIL